MGLLKSRHQLCDGCNTRGEIACFRNGRKKGGIKKLLMVVRGFVLHTARRWRRQREHVPHFATGGSQLQPLDVLEVARTELRRKLSQINHQSDPRATNSKS